MHLGISVLWPLKPCTRDLPHCSSCVTRPTTWSRMGCRSAGVGSELRQRRAAPGREAERQALLESFHFRGERPKEAAAGAELVALAVREAVAGHRHDEGE